MSTIRVDFYCILNDGQLKFVCLIVESGDARPEVASDPGLVLVDSNSSGRESDRVFNIVLADRCLEFNAVHIEPLGLVEEVHFGCGLAHAFEPGVFGLGRSFQLERLAWNELELGCVAYCVTKWTEVADLACQIKCIQKLIRNIYSMLQP
jgi:hypothetical protein